MSGTIRTRTDGAVGWLIFDSPARRNAMSLAMWEGVAEAVAIFAADPNVRLVVMRGAGEEAFVSGADISEFEAERADATRGAHYNAATARAMGALARFEKPLVAAIRGWCMGGGLAIAMKADIRIAAADVRFAIPAARLGVAYPAESIRDLVGLVGPSQAKSILFTARRLDAQEALRLGLVTEVVAASALEARVAELAATLADNAPLSLVAAKEAVDQIAQGRPDIARLEALNAACFDSADYAEGRRAFMEKRRPQFTGR
ncbi:MAG: enoyl-CoA hydratase [Caulobacter sp.]|nr:enoyl-CoA hydratase [Caulobacter sp.]